MVVLAQRCVFFYNFPNSRLYSFARYFKRDNFNLPRMVLPSDKVFVTLGDSALNSKSLPKENWLQIFFKFVAYDGREQIIYFERRKCELLSDTMQRMSAKLSKLVQPTISKKRVVENESNRKTVALTLQIKSLSQHEPIDINTELASALTTGRYLAIGDQRYRVIVVNPARLEKAKIVQRLFTGFPVALSWKPYHCQSNRINVFWFVEDADPEHKASSNADRCSSSNTARKNLNYFDPYFTSETDVVASNWTLISRQRQLILPRDNNLVGKQLAVVAIPYGVPDGETEEVAGVPSIVISQNRIEPAPECLFDERSLLIGGSNLLDLDKFRVLQYNVLADLYVDPGDGGFFPYCPIQAIAVSYRYPLLMQEISSYCADLICLQEVDERLFLSYLRPFFITNAEFCGEFARKGNKVNEGSAMFFRKSKFELCHHDVTLLADLLDPNTTPSNVEIAILAGQNPATLELINSRPSILQTMVLRSITAQNKFVVFATTHLFFHPAWPHVKLIQMALCLRKIENIVESIKLEHTNASVSVVFGGDYNAMPDSAVFQLATTGLVPKDNVEWSYGTTDQHQFIGIDLSTTLNLLSACGCPKYTNYTAGFKNCLDYIFITRELLKVDKIYPMPTEEQLSEFVAIPSFKYPSDHVALLCDLQFN